MGCLRYYDKVYGDDEELKENRSNQLENCYSHLLSWYLTVLITQKIKWAKRPVMNGSKPNW